MARDFPGTAGNFLLGGDFAAIDITGTALTIAAWIRPDSITGRHDVVAKRNAASTALQYEFATDTNDVYFLVGNGGGGFDDVAAGTIVTGAWVHIAGVKNGTGANALKAYQAGAEVGSSSSSVSIGNTAQALAVGRISDANSFLFDGRIADVGIWDAALTAAEIAALAKGVSPLFVRRDHLKGYWPIYGTASPEPDLSNNGNELTVTGTVPLVDHAPVGRPVAYAG